MANLVSGKNLILNPRRIYTLQDKISEQPISLFDTDIVNDRYGNARQIHPGRCYDFLGTNEYVEVPDHDDFSFVGATTDDPFSVSAWVYMDDATWCTLITKTDFDPDVEWALQTIGNDELRFYCIDDSESNAIYAESTALTGYEGEWIYICCTYDGGGIHSGLKIYINGIEDTDASGEIGTYTAMSNTTSPVTIGRYNLGVSDEYFMNGKMHDVRIHAKELSFQEIWEIYHTHSASNYEVGWWKMEESAGDISFDSSGRSHHGTVENATLSTFHVDSSTLPYSFLNGNGYSGGRFFPGSVDVSVGSTGSTDLNPGTGDYSIDGWFFNTNSSVNRCIVSKGGGSPTVEGYYIWLNTSNILTTRHSDGTNQHQITSVAAVPYGWNYFAMVVTRAYAVQQYLNQLPVRTTTQDEQIDVVSSQNFVIGSYTGGSNHYDAYIGTIRYTARALTVDEVRDAMNNGFAEDDDTKMIAQIDDYGKYVDVVGDRLFSHETTEPVYIPRSESKTDRDISGEQLKYYGVLKYNTSIGSMCADFDGTDDYINVSDNDLLSFGDGVTDSPFSISAWINFSDVSLSNIVSKLGEWDFIITSGDLLGITLFDGATDITRATPALTDYENEWVHIAATYDGSSTVEGLKVYVNAERVDNQTFTTGSYVAMDNNSNDINISSVSNTNDGSMCDVRIYNAELSKSDIADVMLGNKNGNEVAWHPLMDGAGEVAHDVSGNGLHGRVTNATLSTFWGQTQDKFHYNIRHGASDGLYFDGTVYGLLDNADAGDLDPGTGDFTIEMIIQTLVDETYFLDFNNIGGYEWFIGTGGKQRFLIDDGSSQSGFTESDTAIDDGLIHHIAITFDRDGDATYYLDGVADGTFDITGEQLDFSIGEDFYLGSSHTPSAYFDGNIYGFRYSNTIRAADDLFSSYTYGFKNDADTVVLWDFKNKEGINVVDENSSNITLTNTEQVRIPSLSTNLRKDVLGHPIQHTGGGLNGGGEIIDFTGGVAAPIWNDCRLGYVELNGTDDYIDCGDHDELSFLDTDGDLPFSISAWINMDDASDFPIVTKHTTTASAREWRFSVTNANTLRFAVISYHVTDPPYISRDCSTGGMTDYEGEWIHVCATYDGGGSSGGINIYINSVSSDVADDNYQTYVGMANTSAIVEIGKLHAIHADGKIRDVKIYAEELTAAQVSEDYKLGGTGATVIRDFRLYKDAYDQSAYKGHGSIQGTNINFPKATPDTTYEQGDYLAYPFYKKSTDNIIVECVTTGNLFSSFNQVYGIWEFDFYKTETGDVSLYFISSLADTAAALDGYIFQCTTSENIELNRIDAGSGTSLFSAGTSFANVNQWYNIRIVRNETLNQYINGAAGTFAVFLDGSLLDVSGGTGTNPVTDTTHTSSRYMMIELSGTGDKMRNFKFNDELVNLSKFQVGGGSHKINSDKESNFTILKRPLIAQAVSRPVFRYTKTGESNA